MIEIIYWTLVSLITYTYFGYPLLVFVLSKIVGQKVKKGPYEPMVSIIIAAYNEEENIQRTLQNKLEQDYPKNKMEIIVVSDGSIDNTDDLVRQFGEGSVKLIHQEPRQGKTAALNRAAALANGEILVFSDSNSIYEKDALHRLVENFNDPQVGYITGKMVYANPDGTVIGDGCSAYMKYENFLRSCEARFNSLVGVNGGIDAMRRSLYQPMRPDQLPDFVLPLKVVQQGYRVVYEPCALSKEPALLMAKDEYMMRVRVSLRALWTLMEMRALFNIFRYDWFSWQLVSHKLLRYSAFGILIALYIVNGLLLTENLLYKISFILQTVFYAISFAGYTMYKSKRDLRLFYIPFYFSLINIAAGHAILKFLRGEKQVLWVPRKG